MIITSTNIAKPTTINWQGKQVTTGIYKTPTHDPIYLGKNDVAQDEVTDRRYHGGEFKACYLFSANQYPYWKSLYPNLNWNWGMFGENLTVEGLDETQIQVADIYKVGGALIQITQPREPCFKLGVKFGSQKVVKQYIAYGYSGTYVRVLEEGNVKTGDEFTLVKQANNSLSIYDLNHLLFAKTKDKTLLELAINNEALPLKKREKLKAFL
ncbi:MOSC domain-containing protein [Aestuariivivens sp. NBU2969]|uniref:MOSC domain-containing protein n=1 Tax=Aestuariivivens sp. NBU2969 TaxID=2873267 RepID=UPI001CBA7640|nr:MOSC domain-containing protein [Aestuariivivens sp. NBU2969]